MLCVYSVGALWVQVTLGWARGWCAGGRAGCGCFVSVCLSTCTSTNAAGAAPTVSAGPFVCPVCVGVQFHATTVRHQNVFSMRACACACSRRPISTSTTSPRPFASTVRGNMKPGPSPRSLVKSGNPVSTALGSAPLGVQGGSARERLPSGGWVGCVC